MKASNNAKILDTQLEPTTLAIIQLTRFGDLLQTAQAVEELKRNHPGYRVVLIARTQFSKPLDFILKNIFDKTYHLDTRKIFDNSEVVGVSSALDHLNSFINEIASERIEILINLSFSKSSAYLSSLIKSQHKIGMYFDFNNKLQINDKWSQFVFSTVTRGPLNPYSLVDLFKKYYWVKDSRQCPSSDKLIQTKYD